MNAKNMTILGNQQPSSQTGRRFNDQPLGVASSEAKRGTPATVKIWSGLCGNTERLEVPTGASIIAPRIERNDYLGGFAITHNWSTTVDTGAANARIVKWDSAG